MQPTYTNSIVNLVSSIVKAGNASPHHDPLGTLPPSELDDGCVLIVIDAMGSNLITDTWMDEHKRDDIHSVFPSETAACLPTFNTGLTPQEHGITGWDMYVKELGSVVTTLPMSVAAEELYFSYDAVEAMYNHETVYERVQFDSHVVTSEELADSAYTECHNTGATVHGCDDVETFFATVEEQAGQDRYVHAYWPDLDLTLHEDGIGEEAKAIIADIDTYVQELDTDVPVIITADHGITETEAIDIADYPRLRETLILPTCGTSRNVYCYVKHERADEFRQLANEHVGHACDVRKSHELLEHGYFGTGPRHDRIDERIGDYTLLMRDGYALYEDEEPFEAVHGGLSREEMHVPLITV